ncbi:hypothetical protein [Paenibacillus cymbidii]|uniref:hypothetical protein n=1 Tax=Paenibacillus cymbidii TaxID=1639034 RepID=UPI001081246A|nr:hypothetical protein [Paenibacillus cymbidii]
MSLKSIDMQLAVQKNNEASIRQSQLLHKPVLDQEMAGEASAKQAERSRQRSAKVGDLTGLKVREDGSSNNGQGRDGKPRGKAGTPAKAADKTELPADHPYKGRHIDLSL